MIMNTTGNTTTIGAMPIRRARALVLMAAVTVLLGGCQRQVSLETRTFRVEYLTPDQVQPLVEPYVYYDRDRAPGTMQVADGAITVRETSDNLARIQETLAEFDRPQPDTRLHFQLIEADGFETSDPRIADVEDELRRLFRFTGYRLAGEATITATGGANFHQEFSGTEALYEIAGALDRMASGSIRLSNVALWMNRENPRLETSVTVRPGQTVVLGSQPKGDGAGTLFLTVSAEADSVDLR